MNKKRIKGIMGFVIIILCGIIVFVYLQKKTDWYEGCEFYGALSALVSDSGRYSLDVTYPTDIKVSDSFIITQGQAKVTIYINDTVIYQETYEQGVTSITTDEYPDVSGKVTADIEVSDDIEGTYSIKVISRHKKLYKWKNK
jgi:hypothetical protein